MMKGKKKKGPSKKKGPGAPDFGDEIEQIQQMQTGQSATFGTKPPIKKPSPISSASTSSGHKKAITSSDGVYLVTFPEEVLREIRERKKEEKAEKEKEEKEEKEKAEKEGKGEDTKNAIESGEKKTLPNVESDGFLIVESADEPGKEGEKDGEDKKTDADKKDDIKTNEKDSKEPHPKSSEEEAAILDAVVVTISGGGSYDDLFSEVPQETAEGHEINVYKCRPSYLDSILRVLQGKEVTFEKCTLKELGVIKKVAEDIKKVDPDSVVFNFECCSGCDEKGFDLIMDCLEKTPGLCQELDICLPVEEVTSQSSQPPTAPRPNPHQLRKQASSQLTLHNIKYLLDSGFMVMCSDFSLKALVGSWDAKLLGPNPFERSGETSSGVRLEFDPVQLADCDSVQLNQVAELVSDKGYCHVGCMGGTIVYSVKEDYETRNEHANFRLEVLTVVRPIHKDYRGFGNMQKKPHTEPPAGIAAINERKLGTGVVSGKEDGDKNENEASSGSSNIPSATPTPTQEPSSSSTTKPSDDKSGSSGSDEESGSDKANKDLLSTDPAYAGHVILHYPSGGKLLCAMTHWVELQKLDVNEERLLQVAEEYYGKGKAAKMKKDLASASAVDRMTYLQEESRKMVQQSAPCQTISGKAFKGKKKK